VIVLPLGADQFYNSARVKELGLGTYYDWLENSDSSEIINLVSDLEKNYSFYVDNCSRVSKVNSLLSSPAIITNLVESFYLSPNLFIDSSLDLSPVDKYSLDIISVFVVLFLIIFWILKKIICFCYCCCRRKKQKKD
jgi:hypothetical protein